MLLLWIVPIGFMAAVMIAALMAWGYRKAEYDRLKITAEDLIYALDGLDVTDPLYCRVFYARKQLQRAVHANDSQVAARVIGRKLA